MWYFSWILGLGLACSFAIFNAMWFELRNDMLVRSPGAFAPKMKEGALSPEMNNQAASSAGQGQRV